MNTNIIINKYVVYSMRTHYTCMSVYNKEKKKKKMKKNSLKRFLCLDSYTKEHDRETDQYSKQKEKKNCSSNKKKC